MAKQSAKRKPAASPYASRSPSPVAELAFRPTPKTHKKSSTKPIEPTWTAYRWVVRALMSLCLFLCAVVYVFCHSSSQATANTQLTEEVAVGVVILVCMSRTWHRKRLPWYFIWVFPLLLAYLSTCAAGARQMYRTDLAQQQQIQHKTLSELQQTTQLFQSQLTQKSKEQQEALETIRNLQRKLTEEESERQETLKTLRILQNKLTKAEEEQSETSKSMQTLIEQTKLHQTQLTQEVESLKTQQQQSTQITESLKTQLTDKEAKLSDALIAVQDLRTRLAAKEQGEKTALSRIQNLKAQLVEKESEYREVIVAKLGLQSRLEEMKRE